MILKKYSFVCCQLAILIFSDFFISGNADYFSNENGGKSRQKRNLVCFLGLTGLVKEVLYDALQDIHVYDPLKLGNTSDGKLKDGVFHGLSTLTNITDMDIRCDNNVVILNTTLGLTNAEIRYKWHRKYLFEFSGSIWTRADEVQFDLEITLSMEEEIKLDVTNTLVTKLDGFKFGFKGLGPLNPVVKTVVNGLHKLWSSRVTKKIERLIKHSLEVQFSKLSFRR